MKRRHGSKSLGLRGAPMIRIAASVLVYASQVTGLVLPCVAQTSTGLQDYFKEYIGLSEEQIADIHAGKAVSKVLKSRTPAEIFVFGAVYIKGDPESYVQFAGDFDRLRKLPEYLALGKFSNPPQVSDLEGFTLDSNDVKALKDCKSRHCEIQIPAQAIENYRQTINWAAPDVSEQVNQLLHRRVIERLGIYQREGNQALGLYHDKDNPTDVPKQFGRYSDESPWEDETMRQSTRVTIEHIVVRSHRPYEQVKAALEAQLGELGITQDLVTGVTNT